MTHLDIKVIGKVQGVGFRFNTKKKAQKLGLKGFVENKDDGSVYIEIEGAEEAVSKFLNWAKTGPRFAKVKRVESKSSKAKNFDNFSINY